MNLLVNDRRSRRSGRLGLAAVAVTLTFLAPAFAQPSEPPPPENRSGPATEDGVLVRDMKERLQHRLNELSGEQDRLRKAMELIDAGAPLEDVTSALRPPGAEGDRPDAGEQPRDRWWERREGGGREEGGPRGRSGGPDGRPGPDRSRDDDRKGARDPAQRERVMAYIRENMPELAARFERLKESNPEIADRIASRIAPRVGEIMELREREPDLADIKQAELTNGLALIDAIRSVRDSKDDPDAVKAAKDNLAARVADQFDIRARLHKNEIDRLRQRLDRLQADLDKQLSQRDQTIQQRTDDMISGKEKMDLFGGGRGSRRPDSGPDGPDSRGRSDRPPGDNPPPPR